MDCLTMKMKVIAVFAPLKQPRLSAVCDAVFRVSGLTRGEARARGELRRALIGGEGHRVWFAFMLTLDEDVCIHSINDTGSVVTTAACLR